MADVTIIGAGAFGLWSAWFCLLRGLSVTVIEADRPGAGASGGPVGALAPHVATRWNAKKAFQRDALQSLGPAIAGIEAVGGGSAGYGRIGRLQPLTRPADRDLALERIGAAAVEWPAAAVPRLLPPGSWPDWVAPAAAPEGLILDAMAARLDPAALVAVLLRAVTARGGRLLAGRVCDIGAGEVRLGDGRVLRTPCLIVAAGAASFPLLTPLVGRVPGGAEKGQALLLAAEVPPGAPLLQAEGLWIVPHASGSVALGSTSETVWTDPVATDAGLDRLLEVAGTLCPALRGARVLHRWAGLRPKARGRDLMLGPVPGVPGVHVATGGHKTGLGMAHAAGQAVAAMICGERVDLPPSFAVAAHLA